MANGYEEALRHAKEIQDIQRKKRQEGNEPSCPVRDKNQRTERHFGKLKNRLKSERTREITKHPERKILDQGERHRQPVKCLETGEVFHSLNVLAKRLGLTSATISIQMSRKRKIKGCTYIRISKEDEKRERDTGIG